MAAMSCVFIDQASNAWALPHQAGSARFETGEQPVDGRSARNALSLFKLKCSIHCYLHIDGPRDEPFCGKVDRGHALDDGRVGT